MVQAEVLRVVQHDVTHQVLSVCVGDIGPAITIEFTLTDVIGDIELIIAVPIRIRTKCRESKTIKDSPSSLTMNVGRSILIKIVNLQQSQRVVDFIGQQILVPLAFSILRVGIGGVVGSGGVEHTLHGVLDITVALRAEDAELELQVFFEGILSAIELHCPVLHVRVLQGSLLLDISDRCTHIGVLTARREGHVMILCQTCLALNLLEEVGVAAHIGKSHTQAVSC